MSSRRTPTYLLFSLLIAVFLLVSSCSSSKPSLFHDGTAYTLKKISEKKLPEYGQGWYFPKELVSILSACDALQNYSLFLDFSQSGMESVTIAFIYSGDAVGVGSAITAIPASAVDGQTTLRMGAGMGFEKRVPVGFLIQGLRASGSTDGAATSSATPSLVLHAADIRPLSVGWSRTPGVTFGFPKDGGNVRYAARCPATFDFSAVQEIPGSVTLGFDCQPIETSQTSQKIVELAVGTEKVQVRQSPAQQKVHLYPQLFRNNASRISVVSNASLVTSVMYVADQTAVAGLTAATSPAIALPDPIPADPGLILTWPAGSWANSDYQLYRWEQFPEVLIFDFADYDIQDQMLKRIAFFTEKAGFKGRLAPDEEIRELHGYNAHDYRAESLAAFFNKASEENFPLNDYEITLRNILVRQGILIPDATSADSLAPARYTAGKGAIISISRESSNSLRWQLLTHECYHGIFFVDPQFRSHVAAVYDTMDRRTLDFLLMYFRTQKSLGYDTEDRYLMHTELMSYLLQQGKTATVEYYLRRADYKSMFTEDLELCQYIKETNAQGFVDAHQRLEAYVFTQYGLKGGRVNLIER